MRRAFMIVALLMATGPVRAEKPAAATAEVFRQADECLARLQGVVGLLARKEEQAVQSNQTERAQCVRQKHSTAVGLLSAMVPLYKRLPVIAEEEGPEALQEALNQLVRACRRAEELLGEADNCRENPQLPRGTSLRRVHRDNGPTDLITPYTPADSPPPGPKSGCFRQERLACLVIRAMELEANEAPTMPCTEVLAHRRIEPLRGWDATRCVELDDFVVVVARALGLPVENPKDPASYLEALRVEGLPVKILVPGDAVQPTADITEAQARAFFASGYAGPFLSVPIRP